MRYNEAGHLNTSIGTYSIIRNTSGSLNTALGFNAGSAGNHQNSTFIGSNTNATTNVVNSTAIGNETVVTASNQVRIGNTSITSIGGQVEWTTLSDGRFKKNIKEDVPGLSFITKLRPVTYSLDVASLDNKLTAKSTTAPVNSEAKLTANISTSATEIKAKEERAKVKYTGFVAQEVEEAAKKMGYDFSGVDAPKNGEDVYGLRYAQSVVPLVKSVQELGKKNEQLEEENKQLKEDVKEIRELITKLMNGQVATTIATNNTSVNILGAYLVQNAPNPFNGTTIIRYHLPEGATSAKLVITNAKGQTLKTISLSSKGDGQLTLQARMLTAGSYTYSLWMDGRQVDAKQMIIQK